MFKTTNKYQQGEHFIYHGDALVVLTQLIPDESVDLIFVDPPYNIGKKFGNFHDKWNSDEDYLEWASSWIDECVRALKPTGTMYLMTSTQMMPYLDLYIRSKLHIISRIVWSYDSSGVQARKHFGSMYEPILHCVKNKKNYCFNTEDILVEAKTGSQRRLVDYRGAKPKPYNTRKVPGNVWDFSRVRYRMDEYEEHPSQKPMALLERIVLASSNPGDTVLDPFAGTFTTAAAALKNDRQSISIEMQEDYLKIGLRRVMGFTTYLDEPLIPPLKQTKIRNFRGIQNVNPPEDLFSVST